METLTDVLAIAGWALFGFLLPEFFLMFSRTEYEYQKAFNVYWSLSFGLIAASIVLG